LGKDDTCQKLHDRATRGEVLTPKERSQLEAWYADQDAAEMAAMNLPVGEQDPAALQAGIDSVLAEIAAVAGRIRETSAQNEILRRENADLRRRLALQRAAHAA
jgi:hypothetical protein